MSGGPRVRAAVAPMACMRRRIDPLLCFERTLAHGSRGALASVASSGGEAHARRAGLVRTASPRRSGAGQGGPGRDVKRQALQSAPGGKEEERQHGKDHVIALWVGSP